MKTEQQIVSRLEHLVTEIEKLSVSIPAEQLENNTVPIEDQKGINFIVGALFILSWVLDCEEELKPIIRAMRLQVLADKFGGKV